MKFEAVDPNMIDNTRQGRRGRVSYPLLKMFLETGLPVAKLDRTGMQQNLQGLTSCLGSYIRNHELPIKMFQRTGELYLARTDIVLDDDGNVVGEIETDIEKLEGTAGATGVGTDGRQQSQWGDPTPITDSEVEQRFAEEVGQTSK